MKFTTAIALAAAAQVAFSVEVVSQIWDGQIQEPAKATAAATATEARPATEAKPATEVRPTTEVRATEAKPATEARPATEAKPATEARATEAKAATEAKPATEARATDVISQIWDGQIQAPATAHPVVQQMENGAGRAIANMGAVVAVAALFL